jgi:hypothetical protein
MISEPLLSIAFIYYRYNQNAKVKEKQSLLSKHKNIRENLIQLDHRIAETKTKIGEISNEEQGFIAAFNQRANRIAQLEKNEIASVDIETNKQLQSLNDEIRLLNYEEADDFRRNLLTLQEDSINNNLSSIQLADASIHGIGTEIKKNLFDAGIFTAAEILDYQTVPQQYDREIALLVIKGKGDIHVNGIGPAKAKSLLEWRRNLAQQYQFSVPKVVSAEVSAQIRTKYEGKRTYFNYQILNSSSEADQRKSNIHTRYRNVLEQNRNEVKRLNRYYLEKKNEQETALAAQYKERNKLTREQTALNNQLLAYKKINIFYFLKGVLQI